MPLEWCILQVAFLLLCNEELLKFKLNADLKFDELNKYSGVTHYCKILIVIITSCGYRFRCISILSNLVILHLQFQLLEQRLLMQGDGDLFAHL